MSHQSSWTNCWQDWIHRVHELLWLFSSSSRYISTIALGDTTQLLLGRDPNLSFSFEGERFRNVTWFCSRRFIEGKGSGYNFGLKWSSYIEAVWERRYSSYKTRKVSGKTVYNGCEHIQQHSSLSSFKATEAGCQNKSGDVVFESKYAKKLVPIELLFLRAQLRFTPYVLKRKDFLVSLLSPWCMQDLVLVSDDIDVGENVVFDHTTHWINIWGG